MFTMKNLKFKKNIKIQLTKVKHNHHY